MTEMRTYIFMALFFGFSSHLMSANTNILGIEEILAIALESPCESMDTSIPSSDQDDLNLGDRDDINPIELGAQVLNQVLSYELSTANSIASPSKDRDVLGSNRKDINFGYVDNDGNRIMHLDSISKSARYSITNRVACCDEYSHIVLALLFEYLHRHPGSISIFFLYGTNFGHAFVAISRPNEDMDQLVIVDPWLRKVFYFHEMSAHLDRAGFIRPPEGYHFKQYIILGNYDPNKHSLRNIKNDRSLNNKINKSFFRLNNYNNNMGYYYVPYGADYDPQVHDAIEIKENEKYAVPHSTIKLVTDCDSLREDFLQFCGKKDKTAPLAKKRKTLTQVVLDVQQSLDDDIKDAFSRFAKHHNL